MTEDENAKLELDKFLRGFVAFGEISMARDIEECSRITRLVFPALRLEVIDAMVRDVVREAWREKAWREAYAAAARRVA